MASSGIIADILRVAIRMEKDTIALFTGLKDFAADNKAEGVLHRIIIDERQHVAGLNRAFLALKRGQRPAAQGHRSPGQGIHFVSPPTDVPIHGIWRQGVANAYAWIYYLSVSAGPSNKVFVWLLQQCAKPLLWVAKFFGLLALTLTLPFSALNLLLYSTLLLPVVALAAVPAQSLAMAAFMASG